MPTEREQPSMAGVRMDPPMQNLMADYLREEGLNPNRLVIQCGWKTERYYIVHIRFLDLYIPAKVGGMKIYLTVEHLFDLTKFALKHKVKSVPNKALIAWSLGVAKQTVPMAHAEWTEGRKQTWPVGYPPVDPYRTLRRDIIPSDMARLSDELTGRAEIGA